MRIADLVKQYENAATQVCRCAAKHVFEIGLGERLDGKCEPLMDGTLREERHEIAAVEHACRLTLAVSHRRRGGDQSPCLPLVPGENSEPVPAPVGIGERRSDRVTTIDPPLGGGAPAGWTS
jgi:hypothetical protein